MRCGATYGRVYEEPDRLRGAPLKPRPSTSLPADFFFKTPRSPRLRDVISVETCGSRSGKAS